MRLIISFAIIFVSIQSLDCLSGNQKQEVSRLNFFDTDLLHFAAQNTAGNVMVSPASIKSTLSMLLEGAEGITEAEIRSALRLSPQKEEYREQLSLYLRALHANSSSTILQNSNSIFVSKNLKLRRSYELMLKNVYLSEVSKLDFSDSIKSANIINSWVNEKTMGLIPSIIEPVYITPTTQMFVTNALYFKSTWKYGFDPKMTQGGCFHVKGLCKKVAMMDLQTELNYGYIDNLRSHALELPYEGGRYSMILLVPLDRDGIINLIRDLPYMSLPQISKIMEPSDVQLSMPKFTIDYSEDLVESLRSLRIVSLFSTSSNLSGIFEGDSARVNSIYHKIHMSVDETGTVAAAASSAMVIPLIGNIVQLRVDRPFLFFIRDNVLGLVLFEGKIEEPNLYIEPNSFNNNEKEVNYKDQEVNKKEQEVYNINKEVNNKDREENTKGKEVINKQKEANNKGNKDKEVNIKDNKDYYDNKDNKDNKDIKDNKDNKEDKEKEVYVPSLSERFHSWFSSAF